MAQFNFLALLYILLISLSFRAVSARGFANKMIDSTCVILVGLLGCGLFMASLVSYLFNQ